MSLSSHLKTLRPVVALLAGASLLLACTQPAGKPKHRAPSVPGDDYWEGEPVTADSPIEPTKVNNNSGAFGAPARPSSTLTNKDEDNVDPSSKVYCEGTIAAKDLVVTEIMIASAEGANDAGEWVEIRSTRECWLKLDGVSVESPRGALAPNVVAVPNGFELSPHGAFVVADSADPAKNHGLTGKVLAWNAVDTLKNDGDSVLVKLGHDTIDSVTYPKLDNLTPGRSLAFPADCTASDRASWSRWSLTFDEFSPGFKGTPNKLNVDVACH